MDLCNVDHANQFAILDSDSYVSEQENMENEIELQRIQGTRNEESENATERPNMKRRLPTKRVIERDEQEWNEVKTKERKLKSNFIEMYISCSEKMPKLFTLAKMLKSHDLTGIEKVKYVNPFKVRIDVNTDICASKLETCQELLDKGWRIHRAMEKNLSFGVIKNVDIDLEDEEILKNIVCSESLELLSIYRLKRRCKEEDGWKACESVRLCFKGSSLPSHVTVDGIRIKVDPYVFPVSQCARCWKLGHVTKRCPSSRIICPKCGGDHANCEIKRFRCVNCDGNHMAMMKSCPSFLKEKKLREIMADFNVTYRRALTMYVPPPRPAEHKPIIKPYKETEPSSEFLRNLFPEYCQPPTATPSSVSMYADVLKTKADVHEENKKPPSQRTTKKRQYRPPSPWAGSVTEEPENNTPSNSRSPEDNEMKSDRITKIKELLTRLKDILFLKGASIQSKLKMGLKCCMECVVFMLVDFIPDWPILQNIFDFFCQNG